MLDALTATVQFCCPNCGATMRGTPAEAGTVQGCRRCGEPIRVPGRRHPVECNVPDIPAVSPQALARCREGVQLLLTGHWLVLVQASFAASAYALWTALEGPAALFARDPGPHRDLFLTVWAIDLLLLAAHSGVKWLGYQKCEAAADAVDAQGWGTLARVAVLLRGTGYLMASAPWLMATTPDADSGLVRGFHQVGHLAWTAGLLLEFAVLILWHRLLIELADTRVAATITRFAAWTAGLVLTASAAVSLTAMTLVLLLRQHAPTPTPSRGVRLNFAAVPPEGWLTVAGVCGLMAAFGVVIWWRYWEVLRLLKTASFSLLSQKL
jgi:hypothetical protein